MSLYQVEAIILKARNLGEADKILTLLTKEHGKLDAVAKGVRKIKSKNRGAVQPFSQSRIMLYQGKNLDTVTQCELIAGFPKIRTNLDRLVYSGYLAELTSWMLPEKDSNQEVYFLLLATWHLLENAGSTELMEIIVRFYEIRMLNLLGYQPELEACLVCGNLIISQEVYFSPGLGGLLCSNCKAQDLKAIPLTKGTIAVWRQLAVMDIYNINRLKLREQERSALENVLQSFIEYQLEYKLKAAQFVQELKQLKKRTIV